MRVDIIGIHRKMFPVAAAQDNAEIPPRVIVQRPVIVASAEIVQVDVEPAVHWDDVPAQQVGILCGADYEVWFSFEKIKHWRCPPTIQEAWQLLAAIH